LLSSTCITFSTIPAHLSLSKINPGVKSQCQSRRAQIASRVQKISSWARFAFTRLHSGACHWAVRAGIEISSLSRGRVTCSCPRHDDNGFASILAVIEFLIWHLDVVIWRDLRWLAGHMAHHPNVLQLFSNPSSGRMLAACSRLLEYSRAVGSPRRYQPLTSTISKDARAEAKFVQFAEEL
jgi:hypothetical protein